MPSDPRIPPVLALLAGEHARYRAAVASAAAQMREYVDVHREQADDASAIAAGELGSFAAGRIDGGAFGALFGTGKGMSAERLRPIARAAEVLGELHGRGDALFHVNVPPGGDLCQAVHDALEEVGRAFGAAALFHAARTGTERPGRGYPLLQAYAWSHWNREERRLAPPLVVSVEGADLHAERLVEFVDGRLRLVLVVQGKVAPAPLVRLVTPGVFVQQAQDVAALGRAVAFEGPAVVALLGEEGESVARFTHDPGAGRTLAERLTVEHLPGAPPRGALGSRSAAQQREELDQLAALGSVSAAARHEVPVELPAPVARAMALPDEAARAAPRPAVAAALATGASGGTASDPVDALTQWLLAQGGFATATSGAESTT